MVTRPSKRDIARAEELARELHAILEKLIESSEDYDVTRVLKRSEAELMDLRHNLSLVGRLHPEPE